jgi:hypothetical protein
MALALLLGVVPAAAPAAPEAPTAGDREAELLGRIAELEDRVRELEDEREDERTAASQELLRRVEALEAGDPAGAGAGGWPANVRLSGSASTGYFDGARDGFFGDGSFEIWDARLFVEADLGREVRLGEQRLMRDLGLVFEWNLVRIGELENEIGDLYADLRGLGDTRWLNLQAGRFQIPVGENYLRFGRAVRDNPFVTNPVGGPWWWDEGLRLYGSAPEERYGYVASVTDGETPFNADADSAPQLTLKLFARPREWLYLSASGLRAGRMGSSTSRAMSALWIGESWPRAFGSGSSVPSFDHGVEVPDGPFELEGVTLAGGDVVLSWRELARLWLAGGWVAIDSDGPSLYDRDLRYWIAELLLEGRGVAPQLEPFYLGLRSSGWGTFDRDEGYLLDSRYASTLGYNQRWLQAASLVLGWRLTALATLRAEYTLQRVALVRGVDEAIDGAAGRGDFLAVDLGVAF